jgi:hypothetical protein
VATWRLPASEVVAFRVALNDASQGQARWLAVGSDQGPQE